MHRFNQQGPEGLRDIHGGGVAARLSSEHLAELAAIVAAGPDREKDGVVRWRRVDLQRVIKQRFGVDFHERYVGTILKRLGFSHMSARPRHPAQNAETIAAFKTYGPPRLQVIFPRSPKSVCFNVSGLGAMLPAKMEIRASRSS